MSELVGVSKVPAPMRSPIRSLASHESTQNIHNYVWAKFPDLEQDTETRMSKYERMF